MFHLKDGSDFRTDISAVMLADGKWYSVYDPTLPNGGEYLSFLQYPDGREKRAVMVNVSLADIKAVAYFGVPATARTEASTAYDAAPIRPPIRMVIARTVENAGAIAANLDRRVPSQTVFASPRSIRDGAGRGLIVGDVIVDRSIWPLDDDVLADLGPNTALAAWWLKTDSGLESVEVWK